MSYIIQVDGYGSYWTGSDEPGKLWTTNIKESKIFDDAAEAEVVVNQGMNMKVVEYDFALSDTPNPPPDWDAIDKELNNLNAKKEEIVELDDFETISNHIHDVNVEVV